MRMNGMDVALAQAREAAARSEVPVGAVLLGPDGTILAEDGNRVEELHDASAHAEILVLRRAGALLGTPRLIGCDLVVTLEPCAMCAAAIAGFRIRRVVFGAYDPKGGGIEHGVRLFDAPGNLHRPEVIGGIRETECAKLLQDFFRARR